MAKRSVGNRKVQKVNAALRRQGQKAKAAVGRVQTTLGDLIAAAFDAAGNSKQARRLLSSTEVAAATGTRFVLV
jgi:hypothetical protein